MGLDSVRYHEETVADREDDHPGRALDYYGSRGETPLRWGGAGAERLGLTGEVTRDEYREAFGPGGFSIGGRQLVSSKRPGFELVVGAHKSVAVAGLVDPDAMHSILDVETRETMGWLDGWMQDQGGRRGRAQERTPTGGLTYAATRHATSRAGDPSPHDHVLVANVVEMLDAKGGHKALDSAALRDTTEAATMVGRLHSAARAVELGFTIEPDPGPSGRLRHWRIVGVPGEVCEVFSKRSDEITDALEESGYSSMKAAGVAARATRDPKSHLGVDQLGPRWQQELTEAGWPLERLASHLEAHRGEGRFPPPLTDRQLDVLVGHVLHIEGELAGRKVFTRTNLIAEVAPLLYGRDPAELGGVLARVLGDREVVPLLHVAGARERAYTTATVLANERSVEVSVTALADRPGPSINHRVGTGNATGNGSGNPRDDSGNGTGNVTPNRDGFGNELGTDLSVGRALNEGQRRAVEAICSSGRAINVLVGVAGSGKTTALDEATTVLEHHGYRVLGTSTSGQAARTLGREADIKSRTLASLLGRLERGTEHLDRRTVVVVDEASMVSDQDLARLLVSIERARAPVVLVGDPRQLGAVGPGGALQAIVERHPEIVTRLEENLRQRNPGEREALRHLRAGNIRHAIDWYAANGRIEVHDRRDTSIAFLIRNWKVDLEAGKDTVILAWRREDVAYLNGSARGHLQLDGHLGRELDYDGRPIAVGERLVTLTPNHDAGLVTSETLTVTGVAPAGVVARTAEGRRVELTGEALGREHVGYGYALTVHRAQGATYDTAHVIAGGGGREVGYVAMSRARDHTTLYATTTDLATAADDLQREWGDDRNQRWISPDPKILELQQRLDALERRPEESSRGMGLGR